MQVTAQLETQMTQRLEKLKEGEVGSLERGVCSAQRMTGELPSPQSETRHHAAAAPACATMQQQHARQPQQTGTSAHSPLGTAHRADWKLAHTTSALQSTLQFTSAGELLTHSVLHTSALPQSKNTSKRTHCGMCSCSMHEARSACTLQFLC